MAYGGCVRDSRGVGCVAKEGAARAWAPLQVWILAIWDYTSVVSGVWYFAAYGGARQRTNMTAQVKNGTTNDSVSRSIFSYDPLSRVTQEGQSILGGTAKNVNYAYDKAGNRLTHSQASRQARST